MDGYEQRTRRAEFGRDDVYIERDTGELIPASMQRARPAMLVIPDSIDAYWSGIGEKSRNMVRKARRLGYEFRAIDPDEYGQDIYEIRTSDPMRQGRPIPEYYYKNPPECYQCVPGPARAVRAGRDRISQRGAGPNEACRRVARLACQ
ncbi:hypothetical protein [Burkholderia ambifaria]|uniref:hypothetical protein n=1 Tax=Burkholderia ambifaria TaxID=152480 RepID=UPI00054F0AB5|nr:hypothetical protein [Burkholderia ambifaria]